MTATDLEDRRAQLDAFAAQPPRDQNLPVPAGVFSAPAERVFGAQQVAVHRDEAKVLQRLRALAAAAGDAWYYRFPVRKKVKDEKTGREEWVTDYIEGPSVILTNDLARIYGNCDVDTRVFDLGDSWVIYARFMDLETGYSLTRPYQQRKSQKVMKTDDARAQDIAFQIGVSKATRNVVVNALQTFADFAFEEARNALVEKIGKKLPEYRTRVIEGLASQNIDKLRVERVIGRAATEWLAPDVAKIIASMKTIADGMATWDEAFPPIEKPAPADAAHDPQTGEIKEKEAVANDTSDADKSNAAKEKEVVRSETKDSQGSGGTVHTEAKSIDKQAGDVSPRQPEASTAAGGEDPKAEGEYVAHAMTWIGELTDAAAGIDRWKREKALRNHCNVAPEVRDKLQAALSAKLDKLKQKDDSVELEQHDQALAAAAKSGSRALDAAIAKVPERYRATLQAAIERRHRPAAAAADAANAEG